ncbi:MAG: NUDIX domain-containing protein [Muribaculaceae bacterium]|nr:NUDIX domain-containing protein [Muribaculaceae bacterium]
MALFYSDIARFPVSVDCVIFGISEGTLSVLLTKRAFEPEKGRWSLMGGFVAPDEGVDQAAKRVLHDLTGLSDVYMQQVGTFGAIDRDPGERVVSVAYCALINVDRTDRLNLEAHNAVWTPLSALPRLGFDHENMVSRALQMVKLKFSLEPVAFRLLPKYFTMTSLQQLYETVQGSSIDKRNFRKRALENSCIEKTELIDKTSSKRGAALFRYNAANFNPETFRL